LVARPSIESDVAPAQTAARNATHRFGNRAVLVVLPIATDFANQHWGIPPMLTLLALALLYTPIASYLLRRLL
jgi:hypothetical protein